MEVIERETPLYFSLKGDDIMGYKCCATCVNFAIERTSEGLRKYCKRLGYDTDPKYVFDCWNPKHRVVELMKKRQENNDK